MNTEITEHFKQKAWVFYDGDCAFCRDCVRRWHGVLEAQGFVFEPQQGELGREKLGLKPGEVLPEIKILFFDGTLLGGMDATLKLLPFVWWGKPICLFARVPGAMPFLRWCYRQMAARRYCLSGTCKLPQP